MNAPSPANVRLLSTEQRRRLLEVHLQLGGSLASRETAIQCATMLGEILEAKVALVTKDEGVWAVLAQSAADPTLPSAGALAWQILDALASALDPEVRVWTHHRIDWTLLSLRQPDCLPLVLAVEGDWSLSAPALLQLTHNLLANEQIFALPLEEQAGRAAHLLTRALGRTVGLKEVCNVVLRHVIRAVPSRLAALAIPTTEDQLAIAATYGYPMALVEDVRIAAGVGVIGSVYQTRIPLLVTDVAAVPGLERRRPRYRTRSFVALPITAGSDILGVVCVTDRTDDHVFTRNDVSMIRTLIAPAALALAREGARQQAQTFAHAAVIDPLSGLFNRRYFYDRLEEELQRALRHNMPVALLMIDIDDFKAINDRFGHIAGDTVIRDVSDILRRSVRLFDVCTRFGGEEFAIVMPGSGAESAASVAERIRRRVEEYRPDEPDLADVRVTASIGLSVGRDISGRELVERADRALYGAKRAGKNRVNTALSLPQGGPGSQVTLET